MLLHARQKTGRHFRTGPVCSQEEHHVESGPPSEPLSRNLVVVSTFSMFAEIKTLALDLWADAQAGEQFGDEDCNGGANGRSEEHTSELQSLMRISYVVFCLKKKKKMQCTT